MTMPSEVTARTGALLDGRYRLGAELGAGGMATVYRATDEALGRTVAVKLFRPGSAGPEQAARTTSETRVLASLNHHSLVTLYDARLGDAGEIAYLVMEYVEGPTLGERIATAPMPRDEVTTMALDLAEALHVVHEARVVHRDIKPSNVLLRPTTTPGPLFRAKLADFGIAYLIDSTRLTTPGTLIGTVAYVSPEQVHGAGPATPADVYALGLVLFEALTGERAFPQATIHESMTARLEHPPVLPGSFGYEWKSLLTAMTAIRPEDRPTALEVSNALRAMGAPAPEPDDTAALTSTMPATRLLPEAPHAPTEVHTVRTEMIDQDPPSRTLEDPHPPRRSAARRLVIVLVLLLIAAAIAAAVLWAGAATGGAGTAPELPALPEPLATHLDQLMREVTP